MKKKSILLAVVAVAFFLSGFLARNIGASVRDKSVHSTIEARKVSILGGELTLVAKGADFEIYCSSNSIAPDHLQYAVFYKGILMADQIDNKDGSYATTTYSAGEPILIIRRKSASLAPRIDYLMNKPPDGKDIKYIYRDDNGDGIWDRFVDMSQRPKTNYVRSGLCWEPVTR